MLCFILEQEMRACIHEGGGEYFENLYWAGFLLSLVADVEDVHLLWRAKTLDFDTWSGFDVQFLVGAGVSRTLSYLHSLREEWAAAARVHLEQCQQADGSVRMPGVLVPHLGFSRIKADGTTYAVRGGVWG